MIHRMKCRSPRHPVAAEPRPGEQVACPHPAHFTCPPNALHDNHIGHFVEVPSPTFPGTIRCIVATAPSPFSMRLLWLTLHIGLFQVDRAPRSRRFVHEPVAIPAVRGVPGGQSRPDSARIHPLAGGRQGECRIDATSNPRRWASCCAEDTCGARGARRNGCPATCTSPATVCGPGATDRMREALPKLFTGSDLRKARQVHAS